MARAVVNWPLISVVKVVKDAVELEERKSVTEPVWD
jgi:hypothetical protein